MLPFLDHFEEKLAASGDPRAAAFSALAVELPKVAAVDDTINESPEDARNRRVAELLRRRQPSGLDAGSASPTPPRDSA